MSIQRLRTDKGWSQEELAMHSGLSVRTIQRIENDKRASLESLKCLAAVFQTSVSALVQEKPMTDTQPTKQQFVEHTEKEAIAYVQNLKGFHIHWITFIVVMPCLYALNLQVSPENLWILIVGAAWGFGLALHAVVLFGIFSLFGGAWEQKQFQKYMNQHRQNVDS